MQDGRIQRSRGRFNRAEKMRNGSSFHHMEIPPPWFTAGCGLAFLPEPGGARATCVVECRVTEQ